MINEYISPLMTTKQEGKIFVLAFAQYDIDGTYSATGVVSGGTCVERKENGSFVDNNPRTVVMVQSGQELSISYEKENEGEFLDFTGAISGEEFLVSSESSVVVRENCSAVEVQTIAGTVVDDTLYITKTLDRNVDESDVDCTVPPDPCTIIILISAVKE